MTTILGFFCAFADKANMNENNKNEMTSKFFSEGFLIVIIVCLMIRFKKINKSLFAIAVVPICLLNKYFKAYHLMICCTFCF